MRKSFVRVAFNGGEVSPAIGFRPDVEKYQSSCLKLENAFVEQTGGVSRRPGTVPVVQLPETDNIRLMAFEFSNDQTYCVAFVEVGGVVRLRVYDIDGVQEADFATDYPAETLREIQAVQSFDVMILTHRQVHPMRLIRAVDDWEFVPHPFRSGPYMDVSRDNIEVNVVARPWIPKAPAAVGDCVVVGQDIDVNSPPAAGNGQDFDAMAPQYLNGLQGHVVDNYQRRIDISDDGTTVVYRLYKTVFIELAEVFANGTDPSRWGAGDVVFITEGSIMPFSSNPWMVAAAENRSTQVTAGMGLFLHSEYYAEHTEVNGVPDPAPVLNYVPSTDVIGVTADTAVFRALNIDDESAIYECVQDVPGNFGGTAVDITNTAHWKRVDAYRGPLWAASIDAESTVFPLEALPTKWRFSEESERGYTGRFFLVVPGVNDTFDPFIQYRNPDPSSDPNDWPAGQTNGQSYPAVGTIRLRTEGGTWDGVLKLQTSNDQGATWDTIGVITSNGNRNAEIERVVEESSVICRVFMERMDAIENPADVTNPNQCIWYLEIAGENYVNTDVDEVLLSGGIFARVTPEMDVASCGVTHLHSLGAFNPLNGYPRAATYFEQRLWFAGTDAEATTIWGSAINDETEWGDGFISAATPVTYALYSNTFNPILWMMGQKNLIAGTANGEFSIGSRSAEAGITAENPPFITRDTGYGSQPIQAFLGASMGFYVERGGGRLMATRYSTLEEGQESIDLTSFASHITANGVVEMAAIRNPERIIFALRDDGVVASLTFEPLQNVTGWARMMFGDGVASVAASSGVNGDNVWLAVKRGDDRWLERMSFGQKGYLDWRVEAENVSVMDTFELPGVPPEGFKLWWRLRPLLPDVEYTIDGTTVTIQSGIDFDKIEGGVQYQHELQTTPLSVGGPTRGGVVTLLGLDIFQEDSTAGEVSFDNWKTSHDIKWIQSDSFTGGANQGTPVFTGCEKIEVGVRSTPSDTLTIAFRSSLPKSHHLYAFGANIGRDE